jgi:two-component system sensor histidine kinase/response regulator
MPQAPSSDTNELSHRADAEALAAAAPAKYSLAILVADDNKLNCFLMAEQLRLLGYVAEIAESGNEALELWRTGTFAVLLTDIKMPGMDGYELAEAIRTEEAGRSRMPIIALSADTLGDQEPRWKNVGIDDCLTKPVELMALKAMLERWPRRAEVGDRATG